MEHDKTDECDPEASDTKSDENRNAHLAEHHASNQDADEQEP